MQKLHLWFSARLLGAPYLAHPKSVAAPVAARPSASVALGAVARAAHRRVYVARGRAADRYKVHRAARVVGTM